MTNNNQINIQTTRSPIDNSVYIERQLASQIIIKQVVEQANNAQKYWQQSTLGDRAKICHAMVDALISNEDEIAEQLCWMMGRPIRHCKNEITGMAERARFMISEAENSLSTISLPEKPGYIRYIQREALGVVFVIAPWNYPYLTAINTIVPAIMAGNSVILKHSAQTPLCAEQFADAFEKAGLAEGVFQYVHLSHQDTEAIVSQQEINYVAFTGSVAGGEVIEKAASTRFIGLTFELGGKDPAYVRKDADLAYAVDSCIDGAFFNAGQSCCAIERLYVDASIYDDFVKQAVALVKQYQLGRPDDNNTTIGPMVNAKSADFVRWQVRDAVSKGAIAHIDAADFPLTEQGGAYLAPQVLSNVDHTMSVMRDESFGPVIGIMKITNDEQAISLMNDSEFGLTAAVYSQNIKQAIAIGEQLTTGTCFVNRCDYLDPALAWTGVKKSGRGCSLSTFGYQALTRAKSFHVKENSN
jgi:acyl-CoA reductase-like NAD-dependent aldehyde dehydrogenase